jgi:sodium transport system ATP-binding protein
MHRGRILAEGTPDELYDRYAEPDLEELFFRLISDHDKEQEAVGSSERQAQACRRSILPPQRRQD